MNVFILLFAISKRLKLQKPDCIHFDNFLFLEKFLAVLEAKISLVKGVGIFIGKVATFLYDN